jgi:GTP-binding protein HflX
VRDPRRIVGEERAICVGLRLPGVDRDESEESLEELAALAESSGATVMQRVLQSRPRIDGRTYIGTGKAEELKAAAAADDANLLVFDHDLSPAQSRNLEKITELKIVDRTEIILDIFARRARTPTAKMQVEVAQLEYFLPRLPHLWNHLSRTGGGIGTRGPGETQLEVDRRRVRGRLTILRHRLKNAAKRFEVQRNLHPDVYRVSLVGYTNVGKSAILNRLTQAGAESHDRLFETLDATTRILALGSGYNATLTDTVGFVRKLPHSLVESFRATLAEVAAAHLLLHVVDAASPSGEARRAAVKEVLREIGAAEIPEMVIYNKIDLLDEESRQGLARRAAAEGNAVVMSARTGEGASELREMIRERIRAQWIEVEGEIPGEESELLAKLTRIADVRDIQPNGGSIRVRALVSPGEWARLASRYGSRAPQLFGRTRGTRAEA